MVDERLVILTKETLDLFLKENNPSDLISLYTFYHYTAKWQGTNQPKCTTSYTAKGLKWSEPKTRKVKKQLMDMGLIEDVTAQDDKGKISGHYIKLNYILKQTTVNEIDASTTLWESHTVVETETNALSNDNINALSNDNKMLTKEKPNKKDVDDEIQELFNAYTTDEEVLELFQDWLDVRKQKRLAKTVRAIKENLNKLDECASNSNMPVVDYLKEVVRRSWGAFYVVPNYEKGNNNGYNGNPQGSRNRQDEHLVRSGSNNGADNKQNSEVKELCDESPATKRFYEITSRPDWTPADFFRD